MAHLNISLDQGLADELVRTVPRRQRSAYVAAAIGEKIARDRQVAGIRESACAWDNGGRGDATQEVQLMREAWVGRTDKMG